MNESVVDYDRDEARSAARDAADPYPEMTRREAEAEAAGWEEDYR